MNKITFYKLYAKKLATVIVLFLFSMSLFLDIEGELFKIEILLLLFMLYYQFAMNMAISEYEKNFNQKEENNESR